MPRSKWTHAICATCWNGINPDREPFTLRNAPEEPCCFCGVQTGDGIYVRASPDSAPLCKGHEDAAP